MTENIFNSINDSFNSNLTTIDQMPSRLGTALGAVIAFLFIVFGLIGDALIIIAILRKRELRNNLVNIFIVSLQLNDIFNICFNQFLVGLAYTFMKWYGPYIICEIFVYTSIICTGCLLWHHALISIHRYLVVVCNQNTSYMGMSPKVYVMISLIIARLIPTLVCAPALINRNMTVYSKAALRCMLAPRVSGVQNLLIVLVNMLIPCIIVIYCFARIFTRVHQVSKNIRKSTLNSKINDRSSTNYGGGEKENNDLDKKDINKCLLTIPNNHHIHQQKQFISKDINSTAAVGKVIPKVNLIVLANKLNNNRNSNNYLGSSLTFTMNSMHREIQISKMFAIIFTVFLFGYLPYGFIRLIDAKNNLHPDVYILLTVLFIISISVSPIIYGLMNTQISIQCVHLIRLLFNCRTVKKLTDVNNERCSSFFVGPTNNERITKIKQSVSHEHIANNGKDILDKDFFSKFNQNKKLKMSSSVPNFNQNHNQSLDDKNKFGKSQDAINPATIKKLEPIKDLNDTNSNNEINNDKSIDKLNNNKSRKLRKTDNFEKELSSNKYESLDSSTNINNINSNNMKKSNNLLNKILSNYSKTKKLNKKSSGETVENSWSGHYLDGNNNSKTNSNKININNNNENENVFESVSIHSNKTKLLIDINDDGGVYKGPPT